MERKGSKMSLQINAAQIPFKQGLNISTTKPQNAQSVPANDNADDKNTKSNNKLALSLAALGTIGAGVLAATIAYKKGKMQSAKATAEATKYSLTQVLQNSKNLDLDAFRSVGTFKDRKAVINGKPFTGNIHTSKSTLTYEDGVLKYSQTHDAIKSYGKYNNNKPYVTIKSYNNTFTEIEKTSGGGVIKKTSSNDGRTKTIEYIAPDGTTTKRTIEKDINRKVVRTDKTVSKGEEKTHLQTLGKKGSSEIFYKKQEIVNGKKVTNTYSKNGSLYSSTTNEYNPKTGILKRTTKYPERKDSLGEITPERTEIYIMKFGPNKSIKSSLSGKLNQNGELENIYIHKNGEFIPEMLHGTQIFKDVRPVSIEKARELIKKHGLPFEI